MAIKYFSNIDIAGSLTFTQSSAAFINHNVTSQSVKFRLSNSSALDVTPFEITPGYMSSTVDMYFGDNDKIRLGASSDLQLYHNGTNNYIDSSTGHLYIRNTAQDKDIIIQGNDGGSTVTALEFDMSGGGTATFGGDVVLSTTKGLYTNLIQAVSSAGLQLGNDNNSGYVFVKDSGEVCVGTKTPSSNNNYGTGDLNVENDVYAAAQIMSHNSTAGNYSFLGMGKSSGTGASPTIVQANETVAGMRYYGYDGNDYRALAAISAAVDGTPVP